MRLFSAPLLLTAVVVLCGCQPKATPKFTPSAEVVALAEEASSEEEKKEWAAIQDQIVQVLSDRCGTPLNPKLLSDENADPQRLKLGAQIYQRRCVQCHGVNGDGQGAVADNLYPLPRDYRKGVFKFTSTAWGSKPRRSDLIRTLKDGVSGTSMPAFDRLSKEELEAVVDYVIALSQRGELEGKLAYVAADEGELDDDLINEAIDEVVSSWKAAESSLVMPVTRMPDMTEETIAMGRHIFLDQACTKCHGQNGRGGFFGNVEVSPDVWGNKTGAADLTSGMFHGGGRPIDLYRRIYSGINGTPMPGFAATFANDPDKIWYLIHFLKDIGNRRRNNLPPVDFAAVDGEKSPGSPANAAETNGESETDEDSEATAESPQPNDQDAQPAGSEAQPDAGDSETDATTTTKDENQTNEASDAGQESGAEPADDTKETAS